VTVVIPAAFAIFNCETFSLLYTHEKYNAADAIPIGFFPAVISNSFHSSQKIISNLMRGIDVLVQISIQYLISIQDEIQPPASTFELISACKDCEPWPIFDQDEDGILNHEDNFNS
jgi:hypothetical protein